MGRLITVDGAWATIEPFDKDHFEQCLRVFDKRALFNLAYRQKRWDGKINFFHGNQFPAGLVDRVVAFYNDLDIGVTVQERKVTEPLDLTRFTDKYLPGITLRPDQMECIRAMLTHTRGVIKSPTGSGKGEFAVAVAKFFWEERGWRSLIVVPKVGLLDQQFERCRKYYGDDIQVGKLGDQQKFLGDVVVGTAATLAQFEPQEMKSKKRGRYIKPADPLVREVVKEFEVLILDETHHASATSWYNICMHSKAKIRLGMSGSPIKENECDSVRMMAATGPVIHEASAADRIAEGNAAKPKIVAVYSSNASGPDLPFETVIWTDERGKDHKRRVYKPYPEAYTLGYVQNEIHNASVVRAVGWLVDRGKRTLVLCRKKEHWSTLNDLLEAAGVDHLSVWGATAVAERNRAKKLLDQGKVKCVLASTIWDEGEDVPGIDAMVFAEGVKANTNSIQRIGRGMRKKSGANEVWVVDFIPSCHPTLTKHGIARVEVYEGEGYEVVPLYEWPDPEDRDFDEKNLLPFERWDEALAAVE